MNSRSQRCKRHENHCETVERSQRFIIKLFNSKSEAERLEQQLQLLISRLNETLW